MQDSAAAVGPATGFLQAHTNKRSPIKLPLAKIQERIAYDAYELASDPLFAGQIVATLVARYQMDRRIIERVIALRGYAYERGYRSLRTGLINAMQIAGSVARRTLIGE